MSVVTGLRPAAGGGFGYLGTQEQQRDGYTLFVQISGTASLAFSADLWTDGPKVVIPEAPRRITYRGVYRTAEYRTGTRFAFWQPLEVPAPSGDIAGIAALAFDDGTSTLTGTGALIASASLTFDDGASVLRGTGALSGALPLTLGGSGALAGTGVLAGAASLVWGGSGALTALDGSIDGTVALSFGVSGALTNSTPVAADDEPISGGYLAEFRRQRRRKRKELKPPEAPTSPLAAQAGPGPADATPQAPAADLDLVQNLVAYWTGEADREQLNRRAQRALDYALRAQTVLAMQLFERELQRQIEDDDVAAMLLLLNDD